MTLQSIAVLAAVAVLLSGCLATTVAGAAVGVAGAAVSVTGKAVGAVIRGGKKDDGKKEDGKPGE
jgi:hypothetical protein